MSSKRISACCSQMRSNRSPFRMGRHDSLALRRATRSPSSRTCACWETASRRSNLQIELTESVLTNYHNLSARRASLSAHIHTTEAVLLFLSHSRASRILALITIPSPHCSSERSAFLFPLTLRCPRHFSPTQAILAEFVTDAGCPSHVAHQTRQWRGAGETRPGWMRVLAKEIM